MHEWLLFTAAPSRVAFGFGASSPSIKSYGAPQRGSNNNHSQGPTFGCKQPILHHWRMQLLMICSW